MSEAAEKLKSELAVLPSGERAELAHFLIQSLDADAEQTAEAAWDVELARRLEEIESGQVVGKPAEAVTARLREKYS